MQCINKLNISYCIHYRGDSIKCSNNKWDIRLCDLLVSSDLKFYEFYMEMVCISIMGMSPSPSCMNYCTLPGSSNAISSAGVLLTILELDGTVRLWALVHRL